MRSALHALILVFLILAQPAYGLSSTGAHRNSSAKARAETKQSEHALTVKSLNLADEIVSASSPAAGTTSSASRLHSASSPVLPRIKALANGDSLVNPWIPGRGAIGVRVKVTW